MLDKAKIDDLYLASDLLYDVSFRGGDSVEARATRRVAKWLRAMAEQRKEHDEAPVRKRRPRQASLKLGMDEVWRMRRAAAAA